MTPGSSAGVLDLDCPAATDGELAVINHRSVLDRCWHVLRRWPNRPGIAEQIVDGEHRQAHFLGDTMALDRLALLSSELHERDPLSPDTHLIAGQIASMRHHFADAKDHLVKAEAFGAPADGVTRVRLATLQALGEDLPAVLSARRVMSDATGDLSDLVPLGALLADLGKIAEADKTYLKAIRSYRDLSPFPLAWVCFHLGVLWAEMAPEPQPPRAAHWYRKAIAYLPAYTHARVHLAELHLDAGELEVAEALLVPVEGSGDPEVMWRLAQISEAAGRTGEARMRLACARSAFDALLVPHELAFADHAAEFYLTVGGDAARARDLALINWANRPTLRARKLALATIEATGEAHLASALFIRAQFGPYNGQISLHSTTGAAVSETGSFRPQDTP